MATVRAGVNGEILQFLATPEQEAMIPGPIPGQVYEVRFDETTNPGLVTDLSASTANWSVPGGTLTKDGIPATINPPERFFTARTRIDELRDKLLPTTNPEALTTEDIRDALAELFRRTGGLG